MEDKKEKEMDEITAAIHKMAIDATPNRRRSQRVRHLKARQFVQNKENKQNKEKKPNKESKQNKQNKPNKEKTEHKENKRNKEDQQNKESKQNKENIPTPKLEIQSNDIVFPLFRTVQYKSILNAYDIQIPSYLNDWLYQLLTIINQADIKKEIDAYSWMVLLYPSLLLMKESKECSNKLKELAISTLDILSDFMYSDAMDAMSQPGGLELNNALICAELFANKSDKIPISVWNYINTLMASCNTFNKFLKISCARSKDMKLVQELLHCSATQIRETKTLYPKVRSKWEAFIGVYTQMVRLHRLYTMETSHLSVECKANIIKMCHIFDTKYCPVLRDLLSALKDKSDTLKMDYAYYRYKTMAMATHTASTIPPAFAGYFGCIDGNDGNMYIDMSLWKVVVDALQSDTERFMKTAHNILSKENKNNKHLMNVINKMAKKDTQSLRILDNICYNSICSMLMFQSYDEEHQDIEIYYAKLMKIRRDMCSIMEELAQHSLLFCDRLSGLDKDILQSCFLTYDKSGKKAWSVHLMSGVLFNYWIPKSNTHA